MHIRKNAKSSYSDALWVGLICRGFPGHGRISSGSTGTRVLPYAPAPAPGAHAEEKGATMGHGGDVIDELVTDHREVEEFFEQFHRAPSGGHDRKRLLDELTIELVRHSVAEEQHLYPAVREHLPGGGEIADKELADHAQVEQMLKDLEGMEPEDPAFDSSVRKLQHEVGEHIHEEESVLFVQMRRVCGEGFLWDLGEKVRTAKKTSPTRPHPRSPSPPPANRLLDPGIGMVDRARDLLTGRKG